MAHSHAHSHSHSHSHGAPLTHVNRAFVIGIALNALFVVTEAAAGFWTRSLALLTDAGHNLSDVASLALALLAFRLAKVKSTPNYTYGYRKSTVLVALLNAFILLIAVGGIGYEAVQRMAQPQPVTGKTVALVAFVGIIINSLTAYLFVKDKENDLNVKGAYLHLAADALVSVGVVIAGLVMQFTAWYWIDPIISIIIMLVILVGTWQLLRDSVRLSLDGVPAGISLEAIQQHVQQIDGIESIHHIHVWAISTTENALTAHVRLVNPASWQQAEEIKREVRHALIHLNIHHATIETEVGECVEKPC